MVWPSLRPVRLRATALRYNSHAGLSSPRCPWADTRPLCAWGQHAEQWGKPLAQAHPPGTILGARFRPQQRGPAASSTEGSIGPGLAQAVAWPALAQALGSVFRVALSPLAGGAMTGRPAAVFPPTPAG